MRLLLRLYPRAWRRRYGEELAGLIDELPGGPGTAVDLLRGAARAHADALLDRVAPRLAAAGGPPMSPHLLQRHSTAAALVAVVVMAPTLIFVVASFFAYQLNLAGVAAFVEPGIAALNRAPRIVDLFLLAAPFIAFVLALGPMVGIGASRAEGELRVTLGLRARALNLLVVVTAIVVGGFLVTHLVAEFLLETP